MRRLIYAPRAYVFIRSENMGGRIYDVSGDVTTGSVTRNVNDLSKAEITLRNRFFKWIVDPKSKRQIFLPMDLITIWLQRVAGKPIQVFTGYLDSVPYYQMYPGNCIIRASCTLKKLAFQWFDPGLTFFHNWVRNIQGWQIDPTTGEAWDTTLNAPGGIGGSPTPAGSLRKPRKKITDGGFARLLFEFLTTIAGWDDKDVLISNLPIDIGARAAKLYSQVEEQTQEDLSVLSDYLRQIMGITFTAENGIRPDGTVTPQAERLTGIIKREAGQENIPARTVIFAALLLSAFDSHKYNPDKQDPHWGFGLYSMRPTRGSAGSNANEQLALHQVGNDVEIDGRDIDEIMSADVATQVMANRMTRVLQRRYSGPHGAAVVKHYKETAGKDWRKSLEWIEDAVGHKIPKRTSEGNVVQFDEEWLRAKQYLEALKTGRVQTPANTTITTQVPKHITWNTPELIDILSPRERRVARMHYSGKGANANLAPLVWSAKQQNDKILLTWREGMHKDEVMLFAPDEEAWAQYMNKFRKKSGILGVRGMSHKSAGDQVTLYKGEAASNSSWAGTRVRMNPGNIHVKGGANMGYPTWAGQVMTLKLERTSEPRESKIPDGLTFGQLGQISLNSAFVAQFAFPSDFIESHALTGNKALMNDVSCLDAVRQFCQASLRNFMSLPDGRFLAFYPDYFGAKRKPYWWIHDIEIVNMGIQLTDDTLATHVYTVGDSGFQNDMLSNVLTRGVVTITQPFILDSFIEGYKKNQTALGKLRDAYAFLQHYGARPHKESIPIIRNSWYEFLMAWQRFMQLWASQFATTVDFTFQPEVMAGGIIGFPQHNLQVYVEAVTHTFDYTSGFSTTATISSPAQMKARGRHRHPGFALAGNINTVGASAV